MKAIYALLLILLCQPYFASPGFASSRFASIDESLLVLQGAVGAQKRIHLISEREGRSSAPEYLLHELRPWYGMTELSEVRRSRIPWPGRGFEISDVVIMGDNSTVILGVKPSSVPRRFDGYYLRVPAYGQRGKPTWKTFGLFISENPPQLAAADARRDGEIFIATLDPESSRLTSYRLDANGKEIVDVSRAGRKLSELLKIDLKVFALDSLMRSHKGEYYATLRGTNAEARPLNLGVWFEKDGHDIVVVKNERTQVGDDAELASAVSFNAEYLIAAAASSDLHHSFEIRTYKTAGLGRTEVKKATVISGQLGLSNDFYSKALRPVWQGGAALFYRKNYGSRIEVTSLGASGDVLVPSVGIDLKTLRSPLPMRHRMTSHLPYGIRAVVEACIGFVKPEIYDSLQ